jgi:hypothetical protein
VRISLLSWQHFQSPYESISIVDHSRLIADQSGHLCPDQLRESILPVNHRRVNATNLTRFSALPLFTTMVIVPTASVWWAGSFSLLYSSHPPGVQHRGGLSVQPLITRHWRKYHVLLATNMLGFSQITRLNNCLVLGRDLEIFCKRDDVWFLTPTHIPTNTQTLPPFQQVVVWTTQLIEHGPKRCKS